MITIITGKPGVGKTALNTFFLEMTYQTDREWLQKVSTEYIEQLNENRENALTVPPAPPLFTNYGVKLQTSYEEYYEPFYVNPYYMGFGNGALKAMYLPPYSHIHISEAQRYYNSRKSQTFPDWVSRFYEMHRHFHYEIYMDVQRGKLIDLNIRGLCKKLIEVQRMEHEKDSAGWISKTRWFCREFEDTLDYEEYIDGAGKNYQETVYEYEGNIFESFNSTSCAGEFVPPEGADFNYLPYIANSGERPEDESIAAYYNTNEPKGYRSTAQAQPKDDKKGAKNAT